MRWLALACALFVASADGAAMFTGPEVRVLGKRIVGKPATEHSPIEQAIEVVESEECAYRVTGTSLDLSGSCRYLSGVYRYTFQPKEGTEGSKTTREVATGFSVSLPGPASHVLMVSLPLTFIVSTR